VSIIVGLIYWRRRIAAEMKPGAEESSFCATLGSRVKKKRASKPSATLCTLHSQGWSVA